jgi:hypothetical protein
MRNETLKPLEFSSKLGHRIEKDIFFPKKETREEKAWE